MRLINAVVRSRFRGWFVALMSLVIVSLSWGCGSDDVEDDEWYTVGGEVSGLEAEGLILQNNGEDDLVVDDDGAFVFPTELADGAPYEVTALEVPDEHSCDISNGTGTIEGDNITDVMVACEASEDPVDPEDDEPHFSVEIDTPASVLSAEVGGTIRLEATVENTGEESGSQDIIFLANGIVRDTREDVELDVGEDLELTLEWDTTDVAVGTYTGEVVSDDDSDTASLTVFELTDHFSVSIDHDPSELTVEEGQTVVVAVAIENTGDESGTQDIRFEIPGQIEEVVDGLSLDEGESEDLVFEWDTEVGDAGDYIAEVHSDNETATADLTVDELPMPHFEVVINESDSDLEVEEAQTASIVVDIENTGDISGTQDITLDIDGLSVDSVQDVELAVGDSQSQVLEWTAPPGSAGTYSAQVWSEDDSDETEVTVELPTDRALFAVSINREDSELVVDEGDPVIIEVDVDNRGDQVDTQDIVFQLDGDEIEVSADLELEGGEVESVIFEWETEVGDAGVYEASVMSDDDADSAQVGVFDPTIEATVSGSVIDETGAQDMEGVEVLIVEDGTDTVVDSDTTAGDGSYEIEALDPGFYEMQLQAPGLEPNHTILEANGGNSLSIILAEESTSQDFTVDWLRETDLLIDGGMIDFQYNDPDGDFEFELPGCEQQPDGSWAPEEIDEEDVEVTLDPDDECFRINDVGIDLATGVFAVETANILFPDITVYIDDSDDQIDGFVDGIEADLDWLLDGVSGAVDFTEGALDIDMDVRLLLGGTVETGFMDIDIGAREGYMDCQLSQAWGGHVTDPTTDDNDEQIGDYLHDPLELRMTTGDSGPSDVSGEPYDSAQRFFVTVGNDTVVGRFSEGEFGRSDPGGASCGEIDLFGFAEDYGGVFNEFLELPADEGSVYMEFHFMIPPQ